MIVLRPYDVFICHKKSSGLDFAKHLKSGLEELGLHTFFDTEDIPQMVDGKEEWGNIRNRAIEESKVFILIITPGFDLSPELRKELSIARIKGNKEFIYFRHRDLARKIVVDLDSEKVDLGRQQQVSFENKEELLRLTHRILLKSQLFEVLSNKQSTQTSTILISKTNGSQGPANNKNAPLKCITCEKPIIGEPHVEEFNGKKYNFDSQECARTYRKLKSVYGEYFE
jgi:hypothetical protein